MRHRYILFSSVLFLVTLCVGSIAFVALIRPVMHENVKTELMWSVERERLKLEAYLNSEIAMVQKMADSPLMQKYLLDPADRGTRAIALEEMAAWRKLFAPSNVYWGGDDRGEIFDLADESPDSTEKNPKPYNKLTNINGHHKLGVSFDPILKQNVLWITTPILVPIPENKLKKVGFVRINLVLDHFIKDLYINSISDELYFFNPKGEITGALATGLVENKVKIADFIGKTEDGVLEITKTLSGTTRIQYFEVKNNKLAIAIDPIPMLDWYVVAVHHFAAIESPPLGMTILFSLMMMVVVTCLVVFNMYVIKMLKPLNYLVKAANQVLQDWELKNEGDDAVTDEIETIGTFLEMTIIDPLTNIYNRRYMDGQLKKIISSLGRSGGELSLFLIDIDYFKRYNDYYGHDEGDNSIKAVAAALARCTSRDDDFVARYGGEEFAVILPHTDKYGAALMAEKLLKAVADLNIPHDASDVATHLTISIGGITGTVRHTQVPLDFVRLADKALYESKKGGRNRYTIGDFE